MSDDAIPNNEAKALAIKADVRNAYARVFRTADGRVVLNDLIGFSGYGVTNCQASDGEDSERAVFFNLGKERVVKRMASLARLNAIDLAVLAVEINRPAGPPQDETDQD